MEFGAIIRLTEFSVSSPSSSGSVSESSSGNFEVMSGMWFEAFGAVCDSASDSGSVSESSGEYHNMFFCVVKS
jgi:hypothetical protein